MKWLKPWMFAALAVSGAGCGSVESDVGVEEAGPRSRAQRASGDGMLPRGLTQEEKALTESDPAQGASQAYAWECNPELYGFTAASRRVSLPSEAESTTGLLIGWPSYGCTVPELTELIRTGVGRTHVTVLVAEQHRQNAQSCLEHRGLSAAAIAQVEWVDVPVDSVWIRDYGPEVVTGAGGERRLVDMSYYPQLSDTCNNLAGRTNDDASPTRLAAAWGGLPVDRAQVRLEGGNLQTDGAGTCFRAQRNANERNCFSRWCYTEAELNEVIGAYHGCNVVALESMVGGVIDHVDMWMTVLSRRTILVGKYDVADDAANAAILDRNAQRLANMGYRVVRVPMPKPYCKQLNATCTGKESLIGPCDGTSERVWATYMNSIRLGNALAVPVFKWVPQSHKAIIAAQEAEALSIYQRELDREFGRNAVRVTPIQSDSLIPCQGSLHCVTMTYR
ncbi:MAG TPA: agmatine deiminase family protein [Myxococcus sp.]|nr:agmatine deiminase family protein [Myxococcus sp.]